MSTRSEFHDNHSCEHDIHYCEKCNEVYCELCEVTWANEPCTQDHYPYTTYPYCLRPHSDEIYIYNDTATATTNAPTDVTFTTTCSHGA